MKGIIYYTDNRLREPIFSTVQNQIKSAIAGFHPAVSITSVSLSPINFGDNITLNLKPSYMTMVKQITTALENSTADIIFFCEHDVLYPQSHFEFTPPKDNIFYYNSNVWRWAYPTKQLITYDRLISLSGLSVNRLFALNHYQQRLAKIKELEIAGDEKLHEPLWARRWGYEPGTKKIKRGGFSDDDFETWRSKESIIDIRHGRTFSQSKVTQESFIHKPENWQETTIDKIDGWHLDKLFDINL